jgi:hypothetical protein
MDFDAYYASIASSGGVVEVDEESFDRLIRHKVRSTNNLTFSRNGCARIGDTWVRPPYVKEKSLW